jgi:DNA topoisomerase-1
VLVVWPFLVSDLHILLFSFLLQRAVFHEITKDAILKAFEHPRDIDMNLVHSQETRRVLDRLAGFTVSPILWRYVSPGLSAGRVQSCGLHSITEVSAHNL